jgi:hypothetical protein
VREPTTFERNRVQEMREEMHRIFAEWRKRDPARQERPGVQGEPDETGITPQLREVLTDKGYF